MLEPMLDCGYRNERSHLVMLCCSGPAGFSLERVIFPFELLTFHAPAGATALIYGPAPQEPELLESCGVETLLLGLDPPSRHPLLPPSMAALLQDLRQRYLQEPSEENRRHLVQFEQTLRHSLPN